MQLPPEELLPERSVASITPKYGPIPVWCRLAGIGRSKTYEMLADGTLRAIKVGGRLLIDIDHGLATFAAMPRAEIHVAPRAAKAAASAAAA